MESYPLGNHAHIIAQFGCSATQHISALTFAVLPRTTTTSYLGFLILLSLMSRIPPALLYLTIYNPTLKPATLDPDDEDAEELAHILFHTAREHAVSRDKILRQVGLAKALVNFSE